MTYFMQPTIFCITIAGKKCVYVSFPKLSMKRAKMSAITLVDPVLLLQPQVPNKPKVCRTCLNSVLDFQSIDELDTDGTLLIREKVQSCVPEMDLYTSEGAIICKSCLESIRIFYDFKERCLEVESRIRWYMNVHSVSDSKSVLLEDVAREFPIIKVSDIRSKTVDPEPASSDIETILILPVDENLDEATNAVDPLSVDNPPPKRPTLYKCLQCIYETDDEAVFRYHVCSETFKAGLSSPPSKPNVQIIPQVKQIPPVLKSGEWYLCNKCPFQTINLKTLNCHQKTIHENQIHQQNNIVIKCSDCDYWTRYPKAYDIHQETEHKFVKCTVCGIECKSFYLLKFHMNLKHPNAKFYVSRTAQY